MNAQASKQVRRGVGLAFALAVGAVALAGAAYSRARRVARVPESLRRPMLYVPLSLTVVPLPLLRSLVVRVARQAPLPKTVRSSERYVPGGPDQPAVKVLIYERAERAQTPERRPALLWIHGGGYVMGSADMDASALGRLAEGLDLVVVSVEYRLAPEHPFPRPLDDCYAALKWLHGEAGALGVDPARIAIGGASAGGGLCAALAQRAHDAGEVTPAFQLLIYPMLDDRTTLKGDHGGRGELLWTPANNLIGWTAYLGHAPAEGEDRPYAAPARRADLSGLPPAWIGVGTLDLFFDEDVDYASRLKASGVACELEIVEEAYHGFEAIAPQAPESAAFIKGLTSALCRGLGIR